MKNFKKYKKFINVDDVIGKMNNFSSEYNKYDNIESILIYEQTNNSINKFITIAIPTLSRYDTLAELLAILNKQNGDIKTQIIIVDNCGIKNTSYKDFVSLLTRYNNLSIKYYVNISNIGMIGNWNRCITLAQTPFISFIHDDDLVDINYTLEIFKCLRTINKRGFEFGILKVKNEIFYSKSDLDILARRKKKKRGGIIEIKDKDLISVGYPISNPPTCGMIINKSALIQCGGFNEYTFPSSDFFIGIQMFRKGYKIFETEDTLGYYRVSINESRKVETVIKFSFMGAFLMTYALYEFKSKKRDYIYDFWYKDWIYGHFKILIENNNDFNLKDIDVLEKIKINSKFKIERKIYRLYRKIYIKLMNLRVIC